MMSGHTGSLDCNLAWKAIFQDPNWTGKVGVGGVLNAVSMVLFALGLPFFPVAIAVQALVVGYLLRTVRYRALNREGKLPEWNEWLELFVSGLTWLAVQFGYFLVVISGLTVAFILAETIGASKFYHPGFLPWAFATGIFGLSMFILVDFLCKFLMINFALREELSQAFNLPRVIGRFRANSAAFLSAWALAVGVGVLSVTIPLMTLILIFIVPSTAFVGQLVAVALLTQAWGPEDYHPG